MLTADTSVRGNGVWDIKLNVNLGFHKWQKGETNLMLISPIELGGIGAVVRQHHPTDACTQGAARHDHKRTC